FPVDLQLFFQNGKDIQLPQLPSEGLTIGALSQQPKQSRAMAGNAAYNVYTFRVAATALRAGKLRLGPAETVMSILVPQHRRGPDPFAPFGDLFGPRGELRQVNLKSNPIEIEALPLPEQNRPQNFNGAIGAFTMAVAATPTNLAVGDPITL